DLLAQRAEVRLRLAVALLEAGDRAAAAEALSPALAEHDPGGLLWAVPLLRHAAAQDWDGHLEPVAVARLRAWVDALEPDAPDTRPSVPGAVADRLTQREAEVVAQIAAGASNKHIARALDLSPHTVKRHVANILDKLGLVSRGEAAAWWNQNR